MGLLVHNNSMNINSVSVSVALILMMSVEVRVVDWKERMRGNGGCVIRMSMVPNEGGPLFTNIRGAMAIRVLQS